jgi:hypothetical protein
MGSQFSAEAYRATALLCRQQAACDPDSSWRLLGEAERWEYLAEQILASRQKNRAVEGATSGTETGMPNRAPSQPETMAAPRPSKPSRFG